MATTLCGASRISRKYYFNPAFSKPPEAVRDPLREICVTFAEDAGGIFTIDFNDEGNPVFTVRSGETDTDIDEIGAEIRIRRLQESEAELMNQLKLFYRIFILNRAEEE